MHNKLPGSQVAEQGGHSISKTKIAIGAVVVLVLAGVYGWLWQSGALEALSSEQALRDQIQRLGIWGPLGIIALMTTAIVITPSPSGPIALVAGAAFGPVWGTLYIVIGAEAGAIVNGGRIPGHRGGVKAGHWRWGAADMARAPIGALAISAVGIDQGMISPVSGSALSGVAWFCSAAAVARRRPADCLRR